MRPSGIGSKCEEIEHSMATNKWHQYGESLSACENYQLSKTKSNSTASKTSMGNALPKEKIKRTVEQSTAQNCTLFRRKPTQV